MLTGSNISVASVTGVFAVLIVWIIDLLVVFYWNFLVVSVRYLFVGRDWDLLCDIVCLVDVDCPWNLDFLSVWNLFGVSVGLVDVFNFLNILSI